MDCRPGFKQIELGFADAEKEGVRAPRLLLAGFLDDEGWAEQALSRDTFLFLGYKGAGKTAVAEHVRLLAEKQATLEDGVTLFVESVSLVDFSYNDFKAAAGSGEAQARYPMAWMWFLLLCLVKSLEGDQAGLERATAQYRTVTDTLRELRLLPVPQLNEMVVTSSKRSFKASLPRILEYAREKSSETPEILLSQAVTAVQQAVLGFPTDGQHVIFVDGLDEIFTQRDLQYQALAALMVAADRLNLAFEREDKPYKFVVLCRTDIFDRLLGANMSKLRSDGSKPLTWFEPGDPDRTRLVRALNLRASNSLKAEVNVFDEFLPARLNGQSTRKVILDHTRHNPRDLFQLFVRLKDVAEDGRRMTAEQVRAGLRAYSIEYFLPSLRDELRGYLPSLEVEKAFQLLTGLSGQRVTMGSLRSRVESLELGKLDLPTLGRVLFECSGLGLLDEQSGKDTHYTFKYRNPGAVFDPTKPMWIHPGACRALNIAQPRDRRHRARRPVGGDASKGR